MVDEHIETAQKFLDDADREYDAGDVLQASEKLWGAASHVVIAEMKRRGLRAQSHRAMVQAVDQFADEFDEPEIVAGFYAARLFHQNFYNGFMTDDEFEFDRPRVQRFVRRMLEFTDYADN